MKKCFAVLAALLMLLLAQAALADGPATCGAFSLDWFQGGAMGIRFIDVTVDEEGADLCIRVDRDVLGFRLEQVWWDDMRQAEVRPLFTADVFESNQALHIRTYLPEVMPTLCVSGWVGESSDGHFECWYIMDSGEDGSLTLMSAEELGLPVPTCRVAVDMADQTWLLSSGVGAWHTELQFGMNGNGFAGLFQDSDMGDTGADYPLGTVYSCEFEADSYISAQLADTVYELTISNLATFETEDIVEGLRLLPGSPYGVEHTDKLLLYLPGTPIADLPEGFVTWARLADLPQDAETLPFWGLYNAADDLGFIGTAYQDPVFADEIDGHRVATWTDENGAAYHLFCITDMVHGDDGKVIAVTGVYHEINEDGIGYAEMVMIPVTYRLAEDAQLIMYQTLNVPVGNFAVDDLGQWNDSVYKSDDEYGIETRIELNDSDEIVYMVGYMMPWG